MPYATTDQHKSGMSAYLPETEKLKPLRGLKAICAYLGRSEKTVLKLISSEGLPAVKIGGGWESDEASIDSWYATRVAL
jgi:excisionase family DNA binding protein